MFECLSVPWCKISGWKTWLISNVWGVLLNLWVNNVVHTYTVCFGISLRIVFVLLLLTQHCLEPQPLCGWEADKQRGRRRDGCRREAAVWGEGVSSCTRWPGKDLFSLVRAVKEKMATKWYHCSCLFGFYFVVTDYHTCSVAGLYLAQCWVCCYCCARHCALGSVGDVLY